MRPFLATLLLDVKLQNRNKFYAISALMVLIISVATYFAPESVYRWLIPLLAFGALQTNTFYFIAGMVLLEKSDASLSAQAVTPLSPHQYLWSKLLTLTSLTVLETGAYSAWMLGWEINWGWWIIGVVALSLIFALCGFAMVLFYQQINTFLFPSGLLILFMSLPIVSFLGLTDSSWMYAHPIQAPMTLYRAGFQSVGWPQLIYGIGISLLLILFFYRFSIVQFQKRILSGVIE